MMSNDFMMNEESNPHLQEQAAWTNEPPVSTEWYQWDFEMFPSNLPELCEKKAIRMVARIYLPVMVVLFCVLGFLGNGILLLVRARYHRVHFLGDILLLHLAISDLLLLLTLPVGVAGMMGTWYLGMTACQALQGFHALTFYSGFLFLMGLTLDRYIAIVWVPLARRLRPTASFWGRLSSGLMWLFSAALAVPNVMYAHVEDYKGFQLCRVTVVRSTVCLVQVGFGFLLPFTIMVICYAAITRTVRSSPYAQSHKALWLILALVLLFLVLQLPYALLNLLDAADLIGQQASSCTVSLQRDLALLITSGLVFARCCLNPVLHTFLGVRFRKDLQRLSREFGCLGHWACYNNRPRSGSRHTSFTTHLEGLSGAP
ncbi:C-C chemokine receptor type 10 [Candoia aspera]|uniref:C-C chemokine receptor type 10 n=1 Tax=Candoia aspera TaxID=51853 RepID=UPI002FD827B5